MLSPSDRRRRTISRRQARIIAGLIIQSARNTLSAILLTKEVQEISFAFGGIVVGPDGYRAVSEALISTPPQLQIAMDPAFLRSLSTPRRIVHAVYSSTANVFILKNFNHLDRPRNRAVFLHEATHAVCDYNKRNTALRSEEAACFLAEGWYHLNIGTSPARIDLHPDILKIARELKHTAETKGRPVAVSGTQINKARRAMADQGYENVYSPKRDGF